MLFGNLECDTNVCVSARRVLVSSKNVAKCMESSLSKHMGDDKDKLGLGPYAISTAILSMYAGF